MKPAPYVYHRAHDVRGAVELLRELGDEAKLLAGGQSLVAMMNFRLARPSALVDINRVDDHAYVRLGADGLRVGALTRHRTVETARDPELRRDYGLLCRAARWIGHYPIRTRGTFGGSIAHGDSTAEWCLLAVLLDAEIVAESTRGRRAIAAERFFHGFLTTELEADEMIVEVRFPEPAPHASIQEFSQRKGDFAIVAATVSLDLEPGGVHEVGEGAVANCRGARIALGGVDAAPIRIPAAEGVLTGTGLTAEAVDEAADVAAKEIEPGDDGHASAGYRRGLARTLVARALHEAVRS